MPKRSATVSSVDGDRRGSPARPRHRARGPAGQPAGHAAGDQRGHGEQLKAQGINSLEGALRNVPGITIAIGEGGTLAGDQFKIRGFDAKDDIYVDGLRDFGVYTRDSFNYEEVQVLKGPSGAMFGRGHDRRRDQHHLQTGQARRLHERRRLCRRRALLPRRWPTSTTRSATRTAVRLNLMGNTTGVVDRDMIYSDRWGAAVTAGFGIGTDTPAFGRTTCTSTTTATRLRHHHRPAARRRSSPCPPPNMASASSVRASWATATTSTARTPTC